MILVLSGTEDGRGIVVGLHERGYRVLTSVATEYGKSIYERMGLGGICIQGRLDAAGLVRLIDERAVGLLVDATHPYATDVSLNAMEACSATKTRYVRFQRPETPLPQSPFICDCRGAAEAIEMCRGSGGKRIMLTTGFNNLKDFVVLNGGNELFVRVLPMAGHIQKCVEMGIHASNIVALQGPFSVAFNGALYDHFEIDTMVTKDSGKEGGVLEKVVAAIERQIRVILIKRPDIAYPHVCSSKENILKNLADGTYET